LKPGFSSRVFPLCAPPAHDNLNGLRNLFCEAASEERGIPLPVRLRAEDQGANPGLPNVRQASVISRKTKPLLPLRFSARNRWPTREPVKVKGFCFFFNREQGLACARGPKPHLPIFSPPAGDRKKISPLPFFVFVFFFLVVSDTFPGGVFCSLFSFGAGRPGNAIIHGASPLASTCFQARSADASLRRW